MPAKTEIFIYYVFTPKYRKDLLVDSVKETVDWAIKDQAKQMNIKIVALTIKPDHLHLAVQLPPEISVAKAAQMLKWRSSIVARQRHLELNEIKAFWAKRYYASSISPINLDRAREFINSR